jgi:hypothetical protein
VALAVDRLAQVLDHHLRRVFDQLQCISDRLSELGDSRGGRR